MKHFTLILLLFLMLLSCKKNSNITESVLVKNGAELSKAIKEAIPGSEIVLANGIWKDAHIKFYGNGTASKPIKLIAQETGKVFIEGESFLHLGGKHLIVDGLYFRNGYSPKESIIAFQINKDSIAFNSQVTKCVIKDFTKPNRHTNDRWIEFYGRYNSLDYCYISGKSNDGETLRVFHTGNKNTSNYHKINNNYFGPRPRKGGPRAETIRVGDSKTNMTPGYVTIADNFFDACNGEVEIISDKTNFNTFKNNIFYKCEGSLVLRHGSYAKVDGNIFIGGDESNFYGGIRVINTGHWITNNYFYKINGSEFRSPLAVMNGIPKSQLNRYKQVTDVVVAHNTWIDCKSPWQIGVGQNLKSIDVLPEVEIRSAPPIRSIIANNLIYNHKTDDSPIMNHHKIDGVEFKNNIIDNQNNKFIKHGSLTHQKIQMKQFNEWLFVPNIDQYNLLEDVYNGFDFENIEQGLFGKTRTKQNYIGAINDFSKAETFKIDKKKYGPSWFSKEEPVIKSNIISVTSKQHELEKVINSAKNGDIIELIDETYTIDSAINIDKELTIRSKDGNKVTLVFTGNQKTAFQMNPKGTIHLKNISLKGHKNTTAFAPLDKNMASAYNLDIDNCIVDNFGCILKASKSSFADTISIKKTILQNCDNGIILAADEKGDYNAEIVTFNECEFKNIKQNIIHFYRGGYDESTIGGILTLTNNIFTNCGAEEKSGVLIKTKGIINVDITNNNFINNNVRQIAVLWGAKNNHHSNNIFVNSGEIKVEEQQKLEVLY